MNWNAPLLLPRVIMAETEEGFEDEWSKLTTELDNLHLDTLLTAYTALYEARNQ